MQIGGGNRKRGAYLKWANVQKGEKTDKDCQVLNELLKMAHCSTQSGLCIDNIL